MKYSAFLLGFILSYNNVTAQLTVIETIPNANSFANVADGITISFSDILDGTTIDQNSVQVFGRWSGPMNGEIIISGVGSAFYFDPQENFFHGE